MARTALRGDQRRQRLHKAAVSSPATQDRDGSRFSTVAGELGSADTVRDPRGFALKLYTDEGNYDLVGNNTPVFFVRDPIKFQDFIRRRSASRDNLRSNDTQWDFWTLSPESAHQVTNLMSDRGIPQLPAHERLRSHTYSWVNAAGERFWVKYHFKTVQGIENLTQAEADRCPRTPTSHRRDLYDAIARGRLPELAAADADHALRGRHDLPVQPVRPDQGLAARRLPADRGRHADLGPQPQDTTSPRSSRPRSSLQHRAGHRV